MVKTRAIRTKKAAESHFRLIAAAVGSCLNARSQRTSRSTSVTGRALRRSRSARLRRRSPEARVRSCRHWRGYGRSTWTPPDHRTRCPGYAPTAGQGFRATGGHQWAWYGTNNEPGATRKCGLGGKHAEATPRTTSPDSHMAQSPAHWRVTGLGLASELNHLKLAGAAGFEPTNAGTKNRCLTAWRRPSDRDLRGGARH